MNAKPAAAEGGRDGGKRFPEGPWNVKPADGSEKEAGTGGRGVDATLGVDDAEAGSVPPTSPVTGGAAWTPNDIFIPPETSAR